MEDFPRINIVEQMVNSIGNRKINVVAGIRRCGKSYLFEKVFLNSKLTKKYFHDNEIINYRLDKKDKNLKTFSQLKTQIESHISSGVKIFLIDEIQLLNGYVEGIKELVDSNPTTTFFITGSNSDILSNDLIHNFKDAANPIYMKPLSYKEIKEVFSDYTIEEYLMYGGLPIIVKTNKNNRLSNLKSIYNELYYEDINLRLTNKLDYISSILIKDIIYNICSTCTPTSPRAIADRIIRKNGNKDFDRFKLIQEVETVIEFLEYSYFIYSFDNEDINNKAPLENIGNNKKYYVVDNGLMFINCKDHERAIGICLENAVFLNLMERGVVPTGKIILNPNTMEQVGEIDFNYNQESDTYHIQVTHTINNNDYQREILNLFLFKDRSTKQVVYLNNPTGRFEDGIAYFQGESYFLQ